MKKRGMLIITLLLVIAISLTACGAQGAQGTAEGFLKAVVAGDSKKAVEFCMDDLKDLVTAQVDAMKAAKGETEGIKIEFTDLKVEEKDDKATATYKFKMSAGGESYDEPGSFELKKVDDKWLVSNLIP